MSFITELGSPLYWVCFENTYHPPKYVKLIFITKYFAYSGFTGMLLMVNTLLAFWHYINFAAGVDFLHILWHFRGLVWHTVIWKKWQHIVLKRFGMLYELCERKREWGMAVDAGQYSYCFNPCKNYETFLFSMT